MRRTIVALLSTCTLAAAAAQTTSQRSAAASQWLEKITWYDAVHGLKPDAIVLIALGAAAKEHGPHLKLSNDAILADYLARRVAEATPVVVAPPLAYHFYPAFLEYPGSTSLSLNTARDLTSDVVRSLARYGPKRFYVLNTGISTLRPLAASAQALAAEGILMRYTNLETALEPAARGLREQEGGSHADEIETSMMLYIDPKSVDMSKAVKDYDTRSTPFGLTRHKGARGTFSPTGIWGDPTLASREKGRVLTEALVSTIVQEIDALRLATPPAATSTPAPPAPARPAAGSPDRAIAPDGCSLGDERTIRAIGDAFTAHWTNGDAESLTSLWASGGDIAHPDGFVERTRPVILFNRRELFKRREYRLSRHPIQLGRIRCLTNDVAVADGKWELRDVSDANGKPVPTVKGLCTLVLKRANGPWLIEAYRYTVDPSGPPPPTLLKRPGWPGRGGGAS